MATHPIDQQNTEQFVHKVLGDTSALTTVVLGALGGRAVETTWPARESRLRFVS